MTNLEYIRSLDAQALANLLETITSSCYDHAGFDVTCSCLRCPLSDGCLDEKGLAHWLIQKRGVAD
jgi:hypothetical protein